MKKKIKSVEMNLSDFGNSLISLYEELRYAENILRKRFPKDEPVECLHHFEYSIKKEARKKVVASLKGFSDMSPEELHFRKEAFYSLLKLIQEMEKWLIDSSEVLFLTDHLRKNILVKIDKQDRVKKFGLKRIDITSMIERVQDEKIMISPKKGILGNIVTSLSKNESAAIENIFIDKNNMFHIWSPSGWVNAMDDELEEEIESIEVVKGHLIARNVIRHDGSAWFKEYICKANFGGWIDSGLTTRYCGRIIAVEGGFHMFKTPYNSVPHKTISICNCKK